MASPAHSVPRTRTASATKQPPVARSARSKQNAKPRGWSAGEGMTYQIFLGPLKIGRAALAVGKPAKRRQPTVMVRGRAEVLPLAGKLLDFSEEQHTTLDLETLRPLTSTLLTQKQGSLKTTRTRYATKPSKRTRQQIIKGSKTRRRVRRLPGGALDPFSALLRMRSVELTSGARQELTVLAGTNLYRLEVTVGGTETLTVAGKQQRAVRVDAIARRISDRGRRLKRRPTTTLTVWLSHDRDRIPLAGTIRNRMGSFSLRLSGYQPSTSRALAESAVGPTA